MRPKKLHRRSAMLLIGVSIALIGGCSTTPAGHDDGLDAWALRTGGRAVPAAAPDRNAPELETLADLLERADAHNPELVAAAQQWRAALERIPQATSLPDPRLSLGAFVDEVETRTGPMDWRAGISQTFPWFGTLDLAGDVAVARADAARERFESARFRVARLVRDTWAELGYVRSAIDVTRGHRDLMGSWESVAQIQYSTGLGKEQDVIRAQVELGKLDDRLRTLEDLLLPLSARLNAVLDRPSAAPLPAPSPTAAPIPDLDEGALAAGLLASSPLLRARQREADAAERAVKLAGKGFYPDLSLGLDYTAIGQARAPGVRGSGDDVLAVTAGISLPVRRDRYRAAEKAAEAEWAAALAALRDTHNTLTVDLQYALYRLRDADRRIGLFRDTLVAKGQESVEITHVAYQAGDADFLDLVDAERVLLEFQLAAARAQADRAQALADVERITGVPLHTHAEDLP